MNDLDWIRKWAEIQPEKIALLDIDEGRKISYRELNLCALRVCKVLSDYKEGDRVAVCMEQSVFLVALFSACQKLGLILVPINYRLSSGEIFKLLKDCAPSLIIYSEHYQSRLALAKDHYPMRSLLDFSEQARQTELSSEEERARYLVKESLPIFLFYTSGTTGAPKGVLYTNEMLFWNSLNTTMQLELTSRDRTVSVLPPYHTSGWNIFLTPLLHNGGFIALLKKFYAHAVLESLEQYRATVFICLPTLLNMLSQDPGFGQADLTSLRYIITGGEMMDTKAILLWQKQKGVYIRPGYGLTEAGPSITSLHQDVVFEKDLSIGKPNFYVDLDIRDESGKSLGNFKVGELCICSQAVTPGYWNNSVATKNQLKDGWFYTGDLAYRDAEGYYFLKGRKDDRYISGGENVYPQEVEQVLMRNSAVEKAVILAVPDATWGFAGAAFIRAKGTPPAKEELLHYMKDKLAKYKCPKYFIYLDNFPVNSVGKISRKQLLEIFHDYVGAHPLESSK